MITESKRGRRLHGFNTYYDHRVCLFVWFGFLTSSSTTGLYRGRAPRHSVRQVYVLPHMRQRWETTTSVSAGHIEYFIQVQKSIRCSTCPTARVVGQHGRQAERRQPGLKRMVTKGGGKTECCVREGGGGGVC